MCINLFCVSLIDRLIQSISMDTGNSSRTFHRGSIRSSMNEKFYDLKKEKQDRMINAGLRIFALNGYHHASTDEIVKEAKISKGLLFHYFGSKAGYYGFLYSYVSRYVILELRSAIREPGIDFWELQSQILETESRLMEQYPAVFLFFESVKMEDDSEGLSVLEELDATVPDIYDSMQAKALIGGYPRIRDLELVCGTIHYIKIGLMRELLYDPTTPISMYTAHVEQYLEMLRALTKG